MATTTTTPASTTRQSSTTAAFVTLIFGLALVFTVGFAQSQTLHNAGHDTRHAMAFPCH